MTITRVPLGVTLSDGTTSTVYRLIEANSSGGNFRVLNGEVEFTDATFFNILAPNGGVVARVAGVQHVSPGGAAQTAAHANLERAVAPARWFR